LTAARASSKLVPLPQPAFNRTRCCAAILAFGWLLGAGAFRCPGSDGVLDDAGYWARTWQTDDGLPRNTVISINQTPDGYLWFGTPFGVVRFDGVTFTRMEGDYYAGFTRARSRVLYTDLHGRLWIGTGTAGIIRHDGNGFTVIDSRNGLPHPTVSTLCEDLRGTVWVGCQDGSLSWVDAEDQVHPVASFRGEPIAGAIQLVRDVQGTLWFAQGNAYGQLVEGAATNVTVIPGAAVVLCPGRRGGLWVSAGPVLERRPAPESRRPLETFRSPVKPNEQPALFEDHAGNLWIGTPHGDLFRRSGEQFILEFSSSHRIQSIFEDAERNLWVGTEGGGVSRLQPRIFHTLTVREGLPQSVLRSVCEAANGDIWLSAQGPALLKWTAAGGLESAAGLTDIGTTCVLPKPGGGVWVGTVGWGLYSVETGMPVRVGNSREFRNRQIRTLHQDAQGRLWVGCLPDGLAQLSGDRFTPPQKFADLGLPRDAIWSMADDAQGHLWVGTIGGELWCYDGTRFTHYGKADGLPGASIGALHFTPNGDLWIGTLGGGLGRLRQGRFVFADMRHGLADDAISSIVDDGLGYFWLSSDRGIVRVSQRDLEAFADGRQARFRSIRYGKDDGLANMECLGGYQPSAWPTRSGAIWFATSKGAVVVNPAAIPTNTPPPMPVLEKILLDDQAVTNRFNLKFAYGYRKLDFKFTAPSFSAPEQVHFRHQLVGLEADWIADGTARSASYPRLAPGKYVFRFTACNREGIWNERPVAIPFEVTPACWQTAWFRAAALLVFGGLVASGVRYRYVQKMRRKLRTLEQARAVEQERMRIARDIHDDLGARLTQMAFLSEMVADEVGEAGKTGKAGERLVRLADSSRAAIRSLDEIVWAVNPRKDSLPDFVDYLSHYANEFFRPSNTRCRQNLPLMIPDLPLPTHFRHHLFLACKEALNNVSKHAQATEVWLKLNVTDGDLEIIIEDNGRGFVIEAVPANGNGVANLSARLAAIGGRCGVESRPGHGTKVFLHVKLPAVPNHNPKTHGPAAAPASSSA
jgi:ligand-binding sensor domain-containing protein/signal transduction histidine kinase